MNKDLPEMYRQKNFKNLNNNVRVFSTMDEVNRAEPTIKRSNINYSKFDIERKINEIFNSKDYIYKADVTIVTDKDTFKKRIVGKVNNQLLTFDNEKIPISEIRDIYK